jgi:hypothetical protein
MAFRLGKIISPRVVALASLFGAGAGSASCGSDPAALKKRVGFMSVDDYVKSGMVVGLGTGSTAYFAVERLGEKLQSGELKDIVAVPTSEATKRQAEKLKIPLSTLNEHGKLDVAIDGEPFAILTLTSNMNDCGL